MAHRQITRRHAGRTVLVGDVRKALMQRIDRPGRHRMEIACLAALLQRQKNAAVRVRRAR